MAEHDVEKIWVEFWEPIFREIADETDTSAVAISLAAFEQIKRELYDYHKWMGTWRSVADEFSGGQLSKVNYTADVYLSAFEEYFEQRLHEAVAEELDARQVTADDAMWQDGYDQGYHEASYLAEMSA